MNLSSTPTNQGSGMFTFIYRDPYECLTECSGDTYEQARDKAHGLFYVDLTEGRWDGEDKSNAVYPKPGTEAERVFNMTKIAKETSKDEPVVGNTYAVFEREGVPSLGAGNTYKESKINPDDPDLLMDPVAFAAKHDEVKLDGHDQFMQDVCNDDAPGYEETNDAMEKLTEDMNPITPVFTGTHSDKRTVNAMEVSEVAKARQAKHDDMLADLGIARAPKNILITKAGYERGTAVIDLGYDNLSASRTTWDNKPDPDISVGQFVKQISKEEREDFIVNLTDIHMNDDGNVEIGGLGTFGVEQLGLGKLLSTAKYFNQDAYNKSYDRIASQQYKAPVPYPERSDYTTTLYPRALSMFMRLDPDIRAYVFNEHMKRHGFDEQEIKVRTRVGGGSRNIFSVVTPSYTTYDADKVAEFLGDVLRKNFPAGMFKAEIGYNSKTTKFTMDATMHAPSDLTDFSAGDLYEVGYRFKSDDVGGGSITGGAIAFWNECLNMIIIDSKTSEIVKVVHKGDVESKMKKMKAGLEKSKEAMQRFAVDWGILSQVGAEGLVVNGEVIETTVSESGVVERAPVALLKTLVDKGHVGKGIGTDAAVQYLLDSYNNQGGGDTMQDVINAVTRMAHESLVDDCVRDGLERQAGMLVPILAKAATTNSVRL